MTCSCTTILSVTLAVVLCITQPSAGQLPQRLQIPGAYLVQPGRPQLQYRQPRINLEAIQSGGGSPVRGRRPFLVAAQVPPPAQIRPVVEDPAEDVPQHQQQHPAIPSIISPATSSFDDEVAKLGINALQNAIRQQQQVQIQTQNVQTSAGNNDGDDDDEPEPQRPQISTNLRPERPPLPVLRTDVRTNTPSVAVRQETHLRQRVNSVPQSSSGETTAPIRQSARQHYRQPASPPPQRVVSSRPPPQYLDAEEDERSLGRTRKPPVQILRKYRTDNADGSITWGYENEDGTFKEETLGIDCITYGKYGYIDPDGVKREYNYETGIKCDPNRNQNLEDEDELQAAGRPVAGSAGPVGGAPQARSKLASRQF